MMFDKVPKGHFVAILHTVDESGFLAAHGDRRVRLVGRAFVKREVTTALIGDRSNSHVPTMLTLLDSFRIFVLKALADPT
jgi:hypothetical protein